MHTHEAGGVSELPISQAASVSFMVLRGVFFHICPTSRFLELPPRGAAGLGTV